MWELRDGTGKDIWLFRGGVLFRSLLDARLVDRVETAIIPVLLGAGVPLLPPGGRVRLTFDKDRVYRATGTVALEYSVVYGD